MYLGVPDDVEKCDNVGSAGKILEDLDLTLDLLLLDRLEDLDDAFLVVDDVDAFEYLGVLPAAYHWEKENNVSRKSPSSRAQARIVTPEEDGN